MKTIAYAYVSLLLLSGCSTPVISMKRWSDGQTTHCGGDMGASINGGLAGYYLQIKKDTECAKMRQSEGFRIEGIDMP